MRLRFCETWLCRTHKDPDRRPYYPKTNDRGAMILETKKQGKQTFRLTRPPSLIGWGSAAGRKEAAGPLGGCFDFTTENDALSKKTWEQAETAFQEKALAFALERAGMRPDRLDVLLAGDLLNQCIASAYHARSLGVPFLGLYGACSTMAEGLALAAMLLDGGFGRYAAALTSSHFCSAERQYRTPLEYGGQKPPTAQWTATGSGAVILAGEGHGPMVTHVTLGKVTDKGITDAANMGAAMAPAAYDTLRAHFADTGRGPEDYDRIVTGDLGALGQEIVLDFFRQDGAELSSVYGDCGVMLFDSEAQDVHAGGSGCGCSALVLTGHLLREMEAGRLDRLLFCGTGALHSPTSAMQGESIPGVCHAVAIEYREEAP